MRAIQRELGDSDPGAGEIKSLRGEAALQELDTPPAAAEYGVARLPRLDSGPAVGKGNRGQTGSEGGGKILNERGLKDRLLEFIAVQ